MINPMQSSRQSFNLMIFFSQQRFENLIQYRVSVRAWTGTYQSVPDGTKSNGEEEEEIRRRKKEEKKDKHRVHAITARCCTPSCVTPLRMPHQPLHPFACHACCCTPLRAVLRRFIVAFYMSHLLLHPFTCRAREICCTPHS